MTIKKTCQHLNSFPYEYEAGKLIYLKEFNKTKIDWYSSFQNANHVRVKSIYCLSCKKIINLNEVIK